MEEDMITPAVRTLRWGVDVAARYVVHAAVAAPSLYNTQPWSFVSRTGAIDLYADISRALPHTDPGGREMVVSCGAALFNLRLAIRHLGFAPVVRLLPSPDRPDHLAEIQWGRYLRPTAHGELLYRAIPQRHTHHGGFAPVAASPQLIAELRAVVLSERADLYVIRDIDRLRLLAELIADAELTQRADFGIAAERTRWTWPPARPHHNGVPGYRGARRPDGLMFAARQPDAHAPIPEIPASPRETTLRALGTVALVATPHDRRLDWLLAGQAMQRLLLYAAAHRVSAAFHTQPLELPGARDHIQRRFTGGAHPQMLLRLGHTAHRQAVPRRPVTDSLIESL
jgi:nitroreductase